MDLLLKIFEVSAITVGVPLVLSILAKLFPLKPSVPTKESISFDVLQSKYGKWVLASSIPYIFFSVADGLLLFRSLIWISHQSLPHVVYFSDGSIWSTRNIVYRADQNLKLSAEKEKVIIAFVAEKCGKEIERYDFLNRDEDR